MSGFSIHKQFDWPVDRMLCTQMGVWGLTFILALQYPVSHFGLSMHIILAHTPPSAKYDLSNGVNSILYTSPHFQQNKQQQT